MAPSSERSVFDNADHDVKLLMMYTRACFYAKEPGNAAAYSPVEACGAHEWSCIAHGWRVWPEYAMLSSPLSATPTVTVADTHLRESSSLHARNSLGTTDAKQCEPRLPLGMRLRGGAAECESAYASSEKSGDESGEQESMADSEAGEAEGGGGEGSDLKSMAVSEAGEDGDARKDTACITSPPSPPVIGRRDVLKALGTAMKQLQKCAETDEDGVLVAEQAALVTVVPLLQARLLHVLNVRLLSSIADGKLPATIWYDAPGKSVRQAYQKLAWSRQPPDDAIILATTPKTMNAWGVHDSMREQAASILGALIDCIPEGEKHVFLNMRAPEGRDDTKFSWFVLSAAGKAALCDAARARLAVMAAAQESCRDASAADKGTAMEAAMEVESSGPDVEGEGEDEGAATDDMMDAEPNGLSGEAQVEGEGVAEGAPTEDEESGGGGEEDAEAATPIVCAEDQAHVRAAPVEEEVEPAASVPLPSSLDELLAALADTDSVFGCVNDPERALRTPAIKAYMKAGGTHPLNKKEAMPKGFHVLKVRASSLVPCCCTLVTHVVCVHRVHLVSRELNSARTCSPSTPSSLSGCGWLDAVPNSCSSRIATQSTPSPRTMVFLSSPMSRARSLPPDSVSCDDLPHALPIGPRCSCSLILASSPVPALICPSSIHPTRLLDSGASSRTSQVRSTRRPKLQPRQLQKRR